MFQVASDICLTYLRSINVLLVRLYTYDGQKLTFKIAFRLVSCVLKFIEDIETMAYHIHNLNYIDFFRRYFFSDLRYPPKLRLT